MKNDDFLKLSNEVANLKETMEIFQQNINNNISWFLSGLAIIIAVVGAALVLLVRFLVETRVEKELNRKLIETLQLYPPVLCASGTGSIVNNKMIINGLKDFSRDQLININVLKLDGSEFHYKFTINENGEIEVDFNVDKGVNLEKYALWNLTWIRIKYDLVEAKNS
ncbi:hypothetical protein ABS315_20960 [Peribacillus frigoritolerans]|uniref:hypothetical protein n=1 Tax=Peribacillus frigoritolerans TaxID=450367 RepID=UPI0034E088D9